MFNTTESMTENSADTNSKSKNNAEENLEEIEESGLKIFVSKDVSTPKNTILYYDKKLVLERLLITSILSQYVRSGKAVLVPTRALDAVGGSGILGFLWSKYITKDVKVSINTSHTSAVNFIQNKSRQNDLNVSIVSKDPFVLLHEEFFNFIHVDCYTVASQFIDVVFKNVPRNGIVVITTKDDCSLYGRTPETALRNYGGVIRKTSYSTELGIRLVIASMARSAAKYGKAINVLCCASFLSSFMIAVQVNKGKENVIQILRNIRRLLHCNMCEERAFLPDKSGFLIDNPTSLLSCKCTTTYPGNVVLELGPVWAGDIFDAEFLSEMIANNDLPNQSILNAFLSQLLNEAMSTSVKISDIEEPLKKIPKLDKNAIRQQITPPFYYNLHRHSPKGPNLMPIDKVIQAINKAGFKASRTHFDRGAVRTNANLSQLINIIKTCSNNNNE